MFLNTIGRLINRIGLDLILAVGGGLLSLALLYVSYYLNYKGLGLVLTLLLSCIFYILFLRKKRINNGAESVIVGFVSRFSNRTLLLVSLILTVLTLLFLIISVYLFYGSSGRPIWYFILVALITCLVSLEIILFQNRLNTFFIKCSILINIFLLINVILLTSLSIYPNLDHTGAGDHQFHSDFISTISQLGRVPTDNTYSNYPMMHLFVSMGSNLAAISSYNYEILLFVYIPYLISLLFIYMIFKKVSDEKGSLLGVLFSGTSLWFILWGLYLVPMAFSVTYFTMLVYFLIVKNNLNYTFLIAFISIAVLFTHPISSIAMIFVSFCLLLISFLCYSVNKSLLNSYYVNIIFTVILVVAYLTSTGYFFESQTSSFISKLTTVNNGAIMSLSSSKPLLVYELDNAGLYVLYFLMITCALSWSKVLKQISYKQILIFSIAAIFIVVSYSTYILGLTTLIPYRWLLFSMLFIGVIASEGLLKISRISTSFISLLILLPIIFGFSFLTITSTTISPDSPLYSTDNYYSMHFSLTDSESRLLIFNVNNINKNEYILGTAYSPLDQPIGNLTRCYLISIINIDSASKIYDNNKIMSIYYYNSK